MGVKSNVWKLYIFRFVSSFSLIAPVVVPFYFSLNFTNTQIFVLTSIYMVATCLFEVPSGYLADIVGRRKTLFLHGLMYVIGALIYAFFSNFYLFALAQFIFGLGGSFMSGTTEALNYDSLRQIKQTRLFKKTEGISRVSLRLGASSASFISSFLVLYSLRLPFYAYVFTCALLIPITLSMIEPERKKLIAKRGHAKEILNIAKYVTTHKKIRSITLYNSLLFSASIIGVWSYYIYYKELGLDPAYNGIIYGVFLIISAAGAFSTHYVEKIIGTKYSFYALALPAVVFWVLGLYKSVYLIPFIFLNGYIWGFSRPLFAHGTNKLIKSEKRATILSVTNMAKTLLYTAVAPVFGKLTDVFSLSTTYLMFAIYFLLVAVFSVYLMEKYRMI